MAELFDSIGIRAMKLPHRIIMGPMEKGMANRDGTLTQRYLGYLRARAAGGAGLIQLESTYVDTIGMGHLYQVGCHDDSVLDGLRAAADAVHEFDARLALEIYLGGRESPSFMSGLQPIAPSVVPCEVLHPMRSLPCAQQVAGSRKPDWTWHTSMAHTDISSAPSCLRSATAERTHSAAP